MIEHSHATNRLHIVTISGAKMGYGKRMHIQLPSDSAMAPRLVLEISYSPAIDEHPIGFYELEASVDALATTIMLNGERIEDGEGRKEVQHGDRLTVIDDVKRHEFGIHIHTGVNTCSGCEQALIPVVPDEPSPKIKALSKNAERRRNVRLMKAEYGLLDSPAHDSIQDKSQYTDRAKKRRRLVGSELDSNSTEINSAGGIYARCRAAPQPGGSVETVELRHTSIKNTTATPAPIESGNKGFQLLKGMGWKEGEGLGKGKQGIQAPVSCFTMMSMM